jgi:hypothetical protein
MSELRINSITDKSGTSGPVISGVTTNASSACLIIPSGNTSNRVGVSTYITQGTIPQTQAVRQFFDAGDIKSNNPADSTNIWRNLSADPDKTDIRFDRIGAFTRGTGATGFIDLAGNNHNALICDSMSKDIFNNGGQGTIFLIFRADDVSTRQTLVSGYNQSSGENTDRWDFEISGGNIIGGNHQTDLYFYSGTTISADTYYTLAITLDKGDDRLVGITTTENGSVLKYYINGSLTDGWAYPDHHFDGLDSPVKISLGRRPGEAEAQNANFEYNGEFNVFITYNVVLDADEVLELHNAFKDRFGL